MPDLAPELDEQESSLSQPQVATRCCSGFGHSERARTPSRFRRPVGGPRIQRLEAVQTLGGDARERRRVGQARGSGPDSHESDNAGEKEHVADRVHFLPLRITNNPPSPLNKSAF